MLASGRSQEGHIEPAVGGSLCRVRFWHQSENRVVLNLFKQRARDVFLVCTIILFDNLAIPTEKTQVSMVLVEIICKSFVFSKAWESEITGRRSKNNLALSGAATLHISYPDVILHHID